MAKGISFHLGLNRVDPMRVQGGAELKSPTEDAYDMYRMARKRGFDARFAVNKLATRDEFEKRIAHAQKSLNPGDIFLLTFSGHGERVHGGPITLPMPNEPPGALNRPIIESDGHDEYIHLHDDRIKDDEFYEHWSRFREGVRIILITDSCRTGTIEGVLGLNDLVKTQHRLPRVGRKHLSRIQRRPLPPASMPSVKLHDINPMVMLISASQDESDATDGDPRRGRRNSTFTYGLRRAWRLRRRWDTYVTFYERLARITIRVQPTMLPTFRVSGPDENALLAFQNQFPFSI